MATRLIRIEINVFFCPAKLRIQSKKVALVIELCGASIWNPEGDPGWDLLESVAAAKAVRHLDEYLSFEILRHFQVVKLITGIQQFVLRLLNQLPNVSWGTL